MNKEDKEFYINCIIENKRLLCREMMTQGELLQILSINFNTMTNNLNELTKIAKAQHERITNLEARLFTLEHRRCA